MLLSPLWPPADPAPRKPEAAHRQGDVVHQDQQVARWVEARKRAERRQRGAAPVHVRLRLDHADGVAVPRARRPPATARRDGTVPSRHRVAR